MENTSLVSISYPRSTLPSASSLFGEAFSFYKAHIRVIFGIGAIPLLFNLLALVTDKFSSSFSILFNLLAFVAAFLALLAFFDLVRAKGNPMGGVWGAYDRARTMFFPYAWVLLLQNAVALGGFFIFIVPGIIFVIFLGQSPYILVVEEKKGITALVQSWHYVQGYWLQVLWRYMFFVILLFLTGLLVFVVLEIGLSDTALFFSSWQAPFGANTISASAEKLFFVQETLDFLSHVFYTPISVIYAYLLYEALRNLRANVLLSAEEEVKMKKTLKIFIIVAIIGTLIFTILAGFLSSYYINHLTV